MELSFKLAPHRSTGAPATTPPRLAPALSQRGETPRDSYSPALVAEGVGEPPSWRQKLGQHIKRRAGTITTCTTAAAVVGAACSPAGAAIANAAQLGGWTAGGFALAGLAITGIPTRGVMGLPGLVVGGLVGVATAAGIGVAVSAAGGLAVLVGVAYGAGYGTSAAAQAVGDKLLEKKSPLLNLKANLPPHARLHETDTSGSLKASLPKVLLEDWLTGQGITRTKDGSWEGDGLALSLCAGATPEWSKLDWVTVEIHQTHAGVRA